ncbi:hypothetical protein E1J38_003455 [Seonamhaeicola sediminis]|uniref:Uncharacterized protein n=1 Tax=Seonamhaeicola sediminis TaxID=2528206 RepID=A0A562YGA1_9FLAO|nr:hypothetical protein [Seonamhaeicola sediminis]TWO33842.1 hypothetical protein E1J38_003455 [Seonamhaeicola sediminis]
MPTIITLVDDSVDISIFYTYSEEEEKGSEKSKDAEKLLFESPCPETVFSSFKPESELEYIFNSYSKPHLNIISPPPEVIIL